MTGQRWMRPVAVLVAWTFSLTQAAPLAYAQHALRPSGTRGNGGAQLFAADSGLSQALQPYIEAVGREAEQLATEPRTAEVRAADRGPAFVSALETALQARVPGGAVRVDGDQVVLTAPYVGGEGNPLLDRTLIDLVRETTGAALHRGGMIPVDQLRGQIAAARQGDAEALRFLQAYAADNPEEFKAQLVELSEDPAALEQLLNRTTLRTTAARMAPPTGGILAADEGAGKPEADGVIRKPGTAGRRLASVGLPETPEHRQAMRRALLTTPGLKASGIDAVILDRDTLTNTVADGNPTTIVEHLKAQGIIPGLKTDEGLKNAPTAPDGSGLKEPNDPEHTKLPALLARANELELGFTKYRTTVPGSGAPEANLRLNAQVQAHQAKLTQEAGLVPIVEPEVTYDGSDGSAATHDLAASEATTTQMLAATFEALVKAGVWLDGLVLKTSMVLAGKNFPDPSAPQLTDPETVGRTTLKVLLKTVPAEVPAIVFLSGGQGDDQATQNLDAIARTSQTRFAEVRDAAVAELRAEGNPTGAAAVAALTQAPWQLSYSFGRGLQAKPLKAWGGKPENVPAAQAAQLANNREVQAARQGLLKAETGWTAVSVPEDLVPALKHHGLQAVKVDVKPLHGQEVPSDLLSDRLNAFGLAGSVSQSLGSYFFAGRGKEVKEIGDGNAVFFAETSIQYFVEQHPDVVVVVLADEGARDDSFSLELGKIYVNGTKIGFSGMTDLLAKLDQFRAEGKTILYFVGDALEKTNGLIVPEAATEATDSNALFSFYVETPETRLGGERQFLNNDNNRIGGVSFVAPDDAGVTPFDVPSQALPKIAASNANAQGLVEGTLAFDRFVADYINATAILALGPRPAADAKAYDKAVSTHRHQAIINDARTLQATYPGLKLVFPGDGDFGPRVVANLGINLDGRHMVVFGRSGSTEARAAMIAVLNSPNARFVHSYVSEKRTSGNYSAETAYQYTDEEIGRFVETHIPASIYASPRATSDIQGTGVLAVTSVTGASEAQYGPSFAAQYRRVTVRELPDGMGTITTSTILSTPQGNFLVRVTLWSEFLASSRHTVSRGIHAAREYWRRQEEAALRARLRTTAARMAPPTGGILAADEGAGKPEADGVIRKPGTAGRRLASVGLPETPEHRQAMRRALLTTPGLKASGIDAVILDRDTLTNTVADGNPTTIVEHLKAQGIIPGLKTDEGLKNAPTAPDGSGLKEPNDPEHTKLPALLARANELELGFTKYRTTVPGSGAPEANLRLNAQVQAHQAKLTQEAGLVPIVEPEVTYDGSDGSAATHDLAASEATTTQMLAATFEALVKAGVWLDGLVLKTSMVLAGKNFPDPSAPQLTDPETVGRTTLKVLLKTVPAEVPAIVFLSGGQGDDQATQNLDAIARTSQTRFAEVRDAAVAELRAEGNPTGAAAVAALTQAPWQLSYSFGRGLQAKPLKAWGGKPENVPAAQAAQLANNREVQAARQGRLSEPKMPQGGGSEAAADPVQAFIEETRASGITADARRLEAAFWAPVLPETSTTVVSPQMARSHARLTHPFWAVVHSSVYDVPGSDAVQARMVGQLATLRERVKDQLPQGIEIPELLQQGALRVALVVEGTATPEAAEAYRQQFLAAFGLPEEFIQVGLPEAWNAEDAAAIEAALLAEVPGSIVGSLVGPSAWLDRLAAAGSALAGVGQVPFDAPGAGKLGAAGNAIVAGFEVAARRAEVAVAEAEGRQPPSIPGRLDVFRELGLPQEHDLVDPQMAQAIAERRRRSRAVRPAV